MDKNKAQVRRKRSNLKYLEYQKLLIEKLNSDERRLFKLFLSRFLSQRKTIKHEYWQGLKRWDDVYEISCFGRIRGIKDGYIKVPHLHHSGYYTTSLHRNAITKYVIYSRIIAENFISNPFNLEEVNHKNLIRIDNRISNIEWSSSKQNSKHKVENSMYQPKIPIVQLTMDGDVIREWESITAAAKSINKPIGNICSTLKGKFNYAYGYKWQYK